MIDTLEEVQSKYVGRPATLHYQKMLESDIKFIKEHNRVSGETPISLIILNYLEAYHLQVINTLMQAKEQ